MVGQQPWKEGSVMTDYEMRQALKTLYGPSWRAKVDKMKEPQVLALYLKWKAEGKIK